MNSTIGKLTQNLEVLKAEVETLQQEIKKKSADKNLIINHIRVEKEEAI